MTTKTHPPRTHDLTAALAEAGVAHAFHRYDGAGHGFQDFVNQERYREAAAADAWDKVLAFFADRLKP